MLENKSRPLNQVVAASLVLAGRFSLQTLLWVSVGKFGFRLLTGKKMTPFAEDYQFRRDLRSAKPKYSGARAPKLSKNSQEQPIFQFYFIKYQIIEHYVLRTNLYQTEVQSPILFQSLSKFNLWFKIRDYLCHHKINVKFNQYIKSSSVL